MGAGRVRRRDAHVLHPAVRHLRHPDPGRQHRLRRLPPPVARSSPATASCPASSPTAATGSCSPTASSCWPAWPALLIVVFGGDTSRPDPALRRRRVHRLHAVARPGMVVHHWQLREPSWRVGAGDQRRRRRHHRHRARRRRGLEVHRSAPGSRPSLIPIIVVILSVDRPPLRPGARRPSRCPTTGSRRRHTAQRRRARRQREHGRARGRQLRPLAGARPADRRVGRGRPGRAGRSSSSRGTTTTCPSSCTRSTRPTGS